MNTVRRLLYREILGAVTFVTVAFLALFFFIDFVDEIDNVGRGAYQVHHAALYCLLQVPGHFYEIFPITVLIGAIYALARLAQSSEFTILRTGGLGPGRALSLLAVLGVAFAGLTFVAGEVAAPYFDVQATQLKTGLRGTRNLSRGAWLKDRRVAPPGEEPPGERMDSISVGSIGPTGELESVRIYEFDPTGQLLTRVAAARGEVGTDALTLEDVRITRWRATEGANLPADEQRATLAWPSTLTAGVVTAAVSPISSMSAIDLYRYLGHLNENEQAVQRYAIQFWKKALYPLACLVMVALALPFAYLHARGGGVSLRVFGGILLGISFVLLNNVSTHLGLLRDWTPWVAASAPSVIYLMLSLAAFSWLVRYR